MADKPPTQNELSEFAATYLKGKPSSELLIILEFLDAYQNRKQKKPSSTGSTGARHGS
jgi:hypothetical protein